MGNNELSPKQKFICAVFLLLGVIGLFGIGGEMRKDKKAEESYKPRVFKEAYISKGPYKKVVTTTSTKKTTEKKDSSTTTRRSSGSTRRKTYNGEENTVDPMDHDIDIYYEDYKEEFEDEDDAWDDFEDNEEYWDDY